MKPVWIILISVVATAIVVGAGTYYFVNSRATRDKNDLQTKIDDLDSKLRDSEIVTSANDSSISATTTPSTADSTSSTNSGSINCVEALSLNALKNATYSTSGNLATDSFKMVNGTYTKGAVTAKLITGYYACDNADKDSVATIFNYNDGGTGWQYYLETMSPFGTALIPTMTALAPLGDRVIIKSLTYIDGTITVNMLTQGPNDSAAEPTQNTIVRYRLPASGVNLVKQ